MAKGLWMSGVRGRSQEQYLGVWMYKCLDVGGDSLKQNILQGQQVCSCFDCEFVVRHNKYEEILKQTNRDIRKLLCSILLELRKEVWA